MLSRRFAFLRLRMIIRTLTVPQCIRVAEQPTKKILIEEMLPNQAELEALLRDSYANYVIQTAVMIPLSTVLYLANDRQTRWIMLPLRPSNNWLTVSGQYFRQSVWHLMDAGSNPRSRFLVVAAHRLVCPFRVGALLVLTHRHLPVRIPIASHLSARTLYNSNSNHTLPPFVLTWRAPTSPNIFFTCWYRDYSCPRYTYFVSLAFFFFPFFQPFSFQVPMGMRGWIRYDKIRYGTYTIWIGW